MKFKRMVVKFMNFSEIKSKEVVRVEDGKKLGYVDDIIFDEKLESVVALKIPISTKLFKKPESIIIDIKNVDKIGENVILIKTDKGEDREAVKNSEYYYSPKVFKRLDGKSRG